MYFYTSSIAHLAKQNGKRIFHRRTGLKEHVIVGIQTRKTDLNGLASPRYCTDMCRLHQRQSRRYECWRWKNEKFFFYFRFRAWQRMYNMFYRVFRFVKTSANRSQRIFRGHSSQTKTRISTVFRNKTVLLFFFLSLNKYVSSMFNLCITARSLPEIRSESRFNCNDTLQLNYSVCVLYHHHPDF